MEEKKEMQALSLDDLEQVSGGEGRTVCNDSENCANIRKAPNGSVYGRVYKDEPVYNPGSHRFRDSGEWNEAE